MAALGAHALGAFVHRPPEIFAATAPGRLEIDFLPLRVADVANPQVARSAIEADAPRVAQPVRPDFAARVGSLRKRITGWDRVGIRGIDIQAQDLAVDIAEV